MAISLAAVATAVIVVTTVFFAVEREPFQQREWTSVTQCLISRDGRRAITLWWNTASSVQGWTHRISLHNTDTAEATATCDLVDAPSCVAAGAEDELFVGSWAGSIYAVRGFPHASAAQLIGQLADGVMQLQTTTDGRCVVSLTPTTLTAWDVAARQRLWQRSGSGVAVIGVLPNSERLICGMSDGAVLEHDLWSGETVRNLLPTPPDWPVHDLDFTADGRLMSIVHANGDVRIISTADGVPAGRKLTLPFCPAGWPRVARFAACGTKLATTVAENTGEVRILDVVSGQTIQKLRGHRGLVLGFKFTEDGRLFTWGNDATIRIWSVAGGRQLGVLTLATPIGAPA